MYVKINECIKSVDIDEIFKQKIRQLADKCLDESINNPYRMTSEMLGIIKMAYRIDRL
jgi:hypothetical protein